MNKQPAREQFHADMIKETDALFKKKVWQLITRSEIKDKKNKPLMSIWLFKRKLSLIGELLKHKARIFSHGGMQT